MARRAAREHGVLDAAELAACGLDRQAILVRIRNGRLHRLYRGVYAVGHAGVSAKGCQIAAVKACGPHAVLSHRSAAEIWDLVDGVGWPPQVTIPPGRRVRRRGIRVHRSDLDDGEWLVLDRIRVTTPVRTIIDLASQLDPPSLRDVLRRAIGTRRVRFEQLLRALARVGSRPGIARLRRLVADGVPTRSELEEAVLALIEEAGIARPDVNVSIVLGDRSVIPDFRWPSARLIVEADGAAWHDDPVARKADRERQRLLEAHGEQVLRVTWREVVASPRATCARIRDAGAPPG